MSLQKLYKYKYDKYGTNIANLIPNESVKFPTPRIVPFILNEGNFYSKDLVVRNKANSAVLTLGTDYSLVGLDPDLTAASGLAVAGGIELADKTFTGELEVTYRTVGGPEAESRALYLELIAAIESAGTNPSVLWEAVIGRPQRFPPSLHGHPLSQFTELEKLTQSLDDVTNAIVNSKPMIGSNQDLMQDMDGLIKIQADMQNSINRIATTVGSTGLFNQLKDSLENIHKYFEGTTNVIGLTWTEVGRVPGTGFNSLRGIFSAATSTDAVHVDFDVVWTSAKDPAYQDYGHIGTVADLVQFRAIKSGGDIVLEVNVTSDAVVKTKFKHLL